MKLLFICIFFLMAFINAFTRTDDRVLLRGHPRLLVTKQDVAVLRTRINHEDFKEISMHFREQLKFKTDGISANGEPDEDIRQKTEALAFSYLLDTLNERQAGLEAIGLINTYLPSIKTVTGYNPNAHTYQAVFTAALVYCWCYYLMDDITRATLIANMKNTSCLAEYCIFKNTPKHYMTGRYGEYAPTVFLAMGIAIYDEQQDGSKPAPLLYKQFPKYKSN